MTTHNALFTDFGGHGPLIHFSHANGYPPETYKAFLEPFTEAHRVIASYHRPLWTPTPEPESIKSWGVFSDDLIWFLDQTRAEPSLIRTTLVQPPLSATDSTGPVIGIGHSMGAAVTLRAAARRPDLFSALVLVEPAFLDRKALLMLRLFRSTFRHKIPLVRKTLGRDDLWDTPQQAFDYHRSKRVFAKIADEVMWDYINYGTCMNEGRETADRKITLRFSKEWEAHCYTSIPDCWAAIKACPVPVIAIRGLDSRMFSESLWRRWQKLAPGHRFLEMEGAGHLVPFEQPRSLSELISGALAR